MKTSSKPQKKSQSARRVIVVAVAQSLLGEGRELLCSTGAGRLYVGPIERAYRELVRRPEAAAPAPRPEDEAAALDRHTKLGTALWSGLASVAAAPMLDPEVQAAAGRVLAALGDRAPTKTTSREKRIERAAAVREDIGARAADLALLPPAADGHPFAEWIDQWCALGRGFGAELVDEMLVPATEKASVRPGSGPLVQRLAGALQRARTALRDEIADKPELPRDLETKLFGLYDLLMAAEARPAAGEREPAAAAEPAPEPTSAAPAAEPSLPPA